MLFNKPQDNRVKFSSRKAAIYSSIKHITSTSTSSLSLIISKSRLQVQQAIPYFPFLFTNNEKSPGCRVPYPWIVTSVFDLNYIVEELEAKVCQQVMQVFDYPTLLDRTSLLFVLKPQTILCSSLWTG